MKPNNRKRGTLIFEGATQEPSIQHRCSELPVFLRIAVLLWEPEEAAPGAVQGIRHSAYICIYVCVCVCVYIYIHRDRERWI